MNISRGFEFVKNAVKATPAVLCAGLAVGAGLGAGGGALMAHQAVNAVPVQSTTQTWQAPVTHDDTLGQEPADQYLACYGFCGGYTNGPADHAVVRANPVIGANGQPEMQTVTRTFSGHGSYNVKDQTEPIQVLSMNGYSTSVFPIYTQEFSHYDTTEVPQYSDQCTTDYQPDGSTTQDCTEEVTGYTTEETPVYVSVLTGEDINYSPDLSAQTIGHYTQPQVTFNSGVPVAGLIVEGVGLGLLSGGLAGIELSTVLATRRNKHGDDPVPDPEPVPAPPPDPDPAPPQPPAVEPGHPLLSGDMYHEHGWVDGARAAHEHYWGDQWHEHDPQDQAASTDQIYFKDGQAPAGFEAADGTPGPNGTIVYDMQKYLQQGVPAS